jgi:hypothetical protein
MPTIAQIEEQILACEGFRVRLTPLAAKTKSFPSYDFIAMAPQRWRASDWKNIRLAAYVTLLREATVLDGKGAPLKRDAQLGNVRDSYYAAKYGSLVAEAPHPIAEPTVLDAKKRPN